METTTKFGIALLLIAIVLVAVHFGLQPFANGVDADVECDRTYDQYFTQIEEPYCQ